MMGGLEQPSKSQTKNLRMLKGRSLLSTCKLSFISYMLEFVLFFYYPFIYWYGNRKILIRFDRMLLFKFF